MPQKVVHFCTSFSRPGLESSAEEGELLPEEDFVLSGSSDRPSSDRGAPARSAEWALRLRRPLLLDGCHFYLQGPFQSKHSPVAPNGKQDLHRLIRSGGGAVLTREPDPEAIPEDESGRMPYHAQGEGGHPLEKCSHYIVFQVYSKRFIIYVTYQPLQYDTAYVCTKRLPFCSILGVGKRLSQESSELY